MKTYIFFRKNGKKIIAITRDIQQWQEFERQWHPKIIIHMSIGLVHSVKLQKALIKKCFLQFFTAWLIVLT